MNKQELLHSAAVEAAKGAPPTSVAITSQMHNWTMANTVTVLTILYLLIQIGWLLWQWRQASKKARQEEASRG